MGVRKEHAHNFILSLFSLDVFFSSHLIWSPRRYESVLGLASSNDSSFNTSLIACAAILAGLLLLGVIILFGWKREDKLVIREHDAAVGTHTIPFSKAN